MLIKTLAQITAKELKNTRGVPPQWKEKCKLVELAWGANRVEADYRDWIETVRTNPPMYPVSEYLKLVDSRLSEAVPEPVSLNNPDITRLTSQAFEMTERTPSNRAVAEALEKFGVDEIFEAFREYILGLEEKELKYAARGFYSSGGVDAVIAVKRKMKAAALPDDVVTRIENEHAAKKQAELQKEKEARTKQKQFEDEHRDEI